jgi:hypothetical protein
MKFIKLHSNFINFALRFSSKIHRREKKIGDFRGKKTGKKRGKEEKNGSKYKQN